MKTRLQHHSIGLLWSISVILDTAQPSAFNYQGRVIRNIMAWFAFICLAPGIAFAEFKIDWWNIGGGAGQSTGGVWTVNGSIGSPSGTASGGAFTLTGGYWSMIGTVPAPESPQLTIERQGGNLRLAWPRSAEAFALQETPTLTGSPRIPWASTSYARSTNATQISVTIPMPPGYRYFQLQKQ